MKPENYSTEIKYSNQRKLQTDIFMIIPMENSQINI